MSTRRMWACALAAQLIISTVARGQTGVTTFEEAKLSVPVGQASELGRSVAISGNTAVAAAPGIDGVAYVYVRTGLKWTQQATLAAADGTPFGSAVAISGDT